MTRLRRQVLCGVLALGALGPHRASADDDEARGRALAAPSQPSSPPVSPYVQMSIGGGIQEDERHGEVHGGVRTGVTGGIAFPFGLRLALCAWLQTFYDSESVAFEEGDWGRYSSSYGASGTYLGGLEIAYRASWDPLAFHVGLHGGIGYGEIDVYDEVALRIVDAGRLAAVVGAHVAAGVAAFGNFDVLLRIDLDYATVGERNAVLMNASAALEWH